MVILEPGMSLSQTVQGKWCYLGARWPVAWQLPGATLCPLPPSWLCQLSELAQFGDTSFGGSQLFSKRETSVSSFTP